MEPLDSRVVVKPEQAKGETEAGIVIPEAAQDKPTKGKVLAVGRGRLLDNGERAEMQVIEGDTVLFSKYSGDKIEFEGSEVLILDEGEILATLK